MGDALDLRRCSAIVVGVFLVSISSVCFSAQKDASVAEAYNGQGVAGHWGKWSCSSLASTGDSYSLRDSICCHVQDFGILATNGVDLADAAVAVTTIPAAQLSVAGGNSAGCDWMNDVMSFVNILTVGEAIGATEPCAVHPSVFLLDLGY